MRKMPVGLSVPGELVCIFLAVLSLPVVRKKITDNHQTHCLKLS